MPSGRECSSTPAEAIFSFLPLDSGLKGRTTRGASGYTNPGTDKGILDENEGVAQRATFIVDPQGIIRFVYVTDLNVSRDPGEVLRVLTDLQESFPS